MAHGPLVFFSPWFHDIKKEKQKMLLNLTNKKLSKNKSMSHLRNTGFHYNFNDILTFIMTIQ